VNIPAEGIALILGVDRPLDMLRTAVNVTGDSVVATVIATSEGQLNIPAE
jgi:proton glutamate symport protein